MGVALTTYKSWHDPPSMGLAGWKKTPSKSNSIINSIAMVFLPTWMVDFHGIHVGEYTSPMDPIGFGQDQ